jgi:hypothetical protein
MRQAKVVSAAVFAISLALYTWTLAPTVTLIDSGELIVAAHTLGIPHPPGFPLYVLLAHAATLVPIANVAQRVNFDSALFGALAAALLTLAVIEAARYVQVGPGRIEEATAQDIEPRELTPLDTLIAAGFSGLLLSFSRTFWSYSAVAEVYTLNTLLILTVLFLVLRWRSRVLELRSRPAVCTRQPSSPASQAQSAHVLLCAASFSFGLALGVHHVTVLLTLPAIVVLVCLTRSKQFFRAKRLVSYFLFVLAGAAVYACLPLAASHSPILNWGNPVRFEQFWWHVSARQYWVFVSPVPEQIGRATIELLKATMREFGPWWFPTGLILSARGFVELHRKQRPVFWFALLLILANVGYALNHEIAEDRMAYYLPSFVMFSFAAGFGVKSLLSNRWTRRSARRSALCAGLLLGILLLSLGSNWTFNNRRHDLLARDYVNNIFNTIEPGGMLLTADWQVYSPLLYVREVERRRRDIVAIDLNLLRRSWYFDYLRRSYPQVMEAVRDRADEFLQDLRNWERHPDSYTRDGRLHERINQRFYALVLGLVTSHQRVASVYATRDVVFGPDPPLNSYLESSYQRVPQGLVFQLFSDKAFHPPVALSLTTRGLSGRAAQDDVVKLKVLPVYVGMLISRGQYLIAHGDFQRALESFREAEALDSERHFFGSLRVVPPSAKRKQ